MIHDAWRQMLTSILILYILYIVCINNELYNWINKEEKLHQLLFIIKGVINSEISMKDYDVGTS